MNIPRDNCIFLQKKTDGDGRVSLFCNCIDLNKRDWNKDLPYWLSKLVSEADREITQRDLDTKECNTPSCPQYRMSENTIYSSKDNG